MIERARSWEQAACAALCACVALLRPETRFVDDAWFYLEIAQRMAAGEGSTFNGVMPTNGYHPLWQWLCTVIASVFDRDAVPTATVALQALLLGPVLFVLARRVARRVSSPYPGLLLAVLSVGFYASAWYGSEAWLNGALQLAALDVLLACHARPTRLRLLACGVLAGLAMLARLDLVFFAGAVSASWLLDTRSARERTLAAALVALACAVTVSPYLAWNLASTGHLMPISGAAKSSFPLPSDVAQLVHKLGRAGLVLSAGALLGGMLALRDARLPAALRRALLILATASGAQLVYVALFTRWGWSTDQGYYYVSALLGTALTMPIVFRSYASLLPSLSSRAKERLAAILAFVIAASGAAHVILAGWTLEAGAVSARPRDPVIQLARWMNTHLPADAVIFALDAPGRLAWFSERRVIAADGLTGSYDYDRALRSPDVQAFLARQGVGWLVMPTDVYRTPWSHSSREGELLTTRVRAPRSGASAGALRVPLRAAVVQLSDFSAQPVDLDAALFRVQDAHFFSEHVLTPSSE